MMSIWPEPPVVQCILRVIRKLREENAKLKRRLTALEQNFLEQQIEITNICRRIQNDFPVSPWDDE